MRRTFFQMAVALCGLTVMQAFTIDLQSLSSISAQSADLAEHECSSNDHDLIQMPYRLPQCKVDTEIFTEHLDTSITKADALAQVGAARQYGYQS